jgi:hypothetical protein
MGVTTATTVVAPERYAPRAIAHRWGIPAAHRWGIPAD